MSTEPAGDVVGTIRFDPSDKTTWELSDDDDGTPWFRLSEVIDYRSHHQMRNTIKVLGPSPKRDRVGTVRRDADGRIWILTSRDSKYPWACVVGRRMTSGNWRADDEMADSEIIGEIPGTGS